ncbi:Uu.00g053920.m01.CDS01 [Anthostomella pinea]|uniref:Uu.00g053920.m01.CDS01 n=1 Tax=Anthostomella pinea TaxID=933095 RepID=A0AAI8YM67_9PEZI|nr:Uu.00g053920.m01.CDS01 [Anthostomella pinea]
MLHKSSVTAGRQLRRISWAILKAHPRNTAGTVTLSSADALDIPETVFKYFDSGADEGLQALFEAVELARDAYNRQLVPTVEMKPGDERSAYFV